MNKLEGFSTEQLLEELVRRRRAYIEHLDEVVAMWDPKSSSEQALRSAHRASATSARQGRSKGNAKSYSKAERGSARKSAAKRMGRESARSGSNSGQTFGTYIVDALGAGKRPMTPRELLPLVTSAGWTTTSNDPEGILRTYLNRMARDNKGPVRALGKNTFELRRG